MVKAGVWRVTPPVSARRHDNCSARIGLTHRVEFLSTLKAKILPLSATTCRRTVAGGTLMNKANNGKRARFTRLAALGLLALVGVGMSGCEGPGWCAWHPWRCR